MKFEVLNNNLVESDHISLRIEMNFEQNVNTNLIDPTYSNIYNYNKADWIGFERDTEIQNPPSNTSIDELNSIITKTLNTAKLKNIPQQKRYHGKNPLPDYLVTLMKKRKSLKSKLKNFKSYSIEILVQTRKTHNLLKEVISGELEALVNLKWNRFIEKQGKHPTSSSPFWKRINFHKKKTKLNQNSFVQQQALPY